MSSQSELLDESLALFAALLNTPDSSNEPWWGKRARQELHDELFRYFVALGGYGTGARADLPRLALTACISGRKTRVPNAPAIAKPVQLGLLEVKRNSLRDVVRLAKLEADLSASFGPQIVSNGGQSPRPADQLAKKFLESRNNLGLSGITRDSIAKWDNGKTDFTTHKEVAKAVQAVLEDCLPFGDWGVSLPRGIGSWFDKIDEVEQWLAGAMDGTPHQDLLAFGLAMTATARAYLADAVCAMVRVALPLHRLYEETRLGIEAMLPMSCRNDSKQPAVKTKRHYNSYMAVGLVELLTGKPMPHLDPSVGDGYLNQSFALRNFCAWQPLLNFWGRGGDGTVHQQFVNALEVYGSAKDWESLPVLQVFYYPKTPNDTSNYIPVEDLRKLMKAHAFPALDLPKPEKDSSKATQPPGKGQKKPDNKAANAAYKTCGHFIDKYDTCGHFITHLRLHVAIELSSRLAAALAKRSSPDLSPHGEHYIQIGGGSQRWGGNHLPHAEHRDGFTYDISCPMQYKPWATQQLKELPHMSDPGKRQARKSVFAVGVPTEDKDKGPYPLLAAVLNDSKKVDSIPRQAFSKLVKQLMEGKPGDGDEWDNLAATPILLRNGQLDDAGLVENLVGHVALVLAGVVKWIFSSWYEHLFALRATAALLAPGKCPDSLKLPAKTIRPAITGAKFYWKPLDHYDHWHVVFAMGTDPRHRHSLGPTPYQIHPGELLAWVTLWDALGVDLISFMKCLERRSIAHEHESEFADAVKERQTILEALEKLQASMEKMSDDAVVEKRKLQDQTLDLLVEGIRAAKWRDIPSLAGNLNYKDWLKNSRLARRYKVDQAQRYELGGWQTWPSDTDTDPASLEKSGPPTETDVEVQ